MKQTFRDNLRMKAETTGLKPRQRWQAQSLYLLEKDVNKYKLFYLECKTCPFATFAKTFDQAKDFLYAHNGHDTIITGKRGFRDGDI